MSDLPQLGELGPSSVASRAVTYLVSGHCTLTSEISVGGGRFARALVGVTRGWIPGGETPGAEELVEHLDKIRGEEDLVFPLSAVEEIELARSLV
jgi:hypothetical protein